MSAADRFILDLRRERDAETARYDEEIAECHREAERLMERRDAMILDFDSRIGDMHDALEKGLDTVCAECATGDEQAGVVTHCEVCGVRVWTP